MLGKSFKSSKCKTLLKLAMSRIKLLRNKRDIQVKQLRRDIAQLLGTGQEPSARIRVEHVIREQNVLDAYDMVELYAELVVVRMPVINGQKTCPADLKEAIASLIFAAARCADLPELADIKSCFALKYGKEFVAGAAELRPSCGVSRRLIEKMSVRAPSGETKLKVLKDIAGEFRFAWDPADTEAELLKKPEDLLEGPQKFMPATELPREPIRRMTPPPPPAAPTYMNTMRMPKPQASENQNFNPPPAPPSFVKSSPRKPQDIPEDHHESSPAYKDVAAAAQAAADSAEQAAAAARAVANLATRQVLLGLSEQILNAPVGQDEEAEEDMSPRYKLRDYLNGSVNDSLESPVANRFRFNEHNSTVRCSAEELFRQSSASPRTSDDYDDLSARFQALKARR